MVCFALGFWNPNRLSHTSAWTYHVRLENCFLQVVKPQGPNVKYSFQLCNLIISYLCLMIGYLPILSTIPWTTNMHTNRKNKYLPIAISESSTESCEEWYTVMENHHAIHGKTHQFSMAMASMAILTTYQRGMLVCSFHPIDSWRTH